MSLTDRLLSAYISLHRIEQWSDEEKETATETLKKFERQIWDGEEALTLEEMAKEMDEIRKSMDRYSVELKSLNASISEQLRQRRRDATPETDDGVYAYLLKRFVGREAKSKPRQRTSVKLGKIPELASFMPRLADYEEK